MPYGVISVLCKMRQYYVSSFWMGSDILRILPALHSSYNTTQNPKVIQIMTNKF